MERKERNRLIVKRIFNRYTDIYKRVFIGHKTFENKKFWWVSKKDKKLQDHYLINFNSYLSVIELNIIDNSDELIIKQILIDLKAFVEDNIIPINFHYLTNIDIEKIKVWPPYYKDFIYLFKVYKKEEADKIKYKPQDRLPLEENSRLISYTFESYLNNLYEIRNNGYCYIALSPVYKIPLEYNKVENELDFINYLIDDKIIRPFLLSKLNVFNFSKELNDIILDNIVNK